MKGNDLEDNKGFVATPFAAVNTALGGGIAVGKITEVAGSWSVGKSTFAYQVIGAAQKQNRPCLLLDAERAYSKDYGAALGIDNAQLDIFRAKTAEEYLDHSIEWAIAINNLPFVSMLRFLLFLHIYVSLCYVCGANSELCVSFCAHSRMCLPSSGSVQSRMARRLSMPLYFERSKPSARERSCRFSLLPIPLNPISRLGM